MNYFKLWNEVNQLVLEKGTLFERNAMLEKKNPRIWKNSLKRYWTRKCQNHALNCLVEW